MCEREQGIRAIFLLFIQIRRLYVSDGKITHDFIYHLWIFHLNCFVSGLLNVSCFYQNYSAGVCISGGCVKT